MSRWTQNKFKYKKNYDVWIGADYFIYDITTDQKNFRVWRHNLDYKATRENLKKAGYTNINIVCLGRDVTF